MRVIAHLIAVMLLVPGIVVSVALLGIGHLAAQGNMLALVTALFDLALAFLPVAFGLFVLWFGLALMGFSRRLRRAAAICVGVIAAGTTALIVWQSGPYAYANQAGIFVPGACALIIAIWLASTDWADAPSRDAAAGMTPAPRRVE